MAKHSQVAVESHVELSALLRGRFVDWYPAHYEHKSRKARADRCAKREREAARRRERVYDEKSCALADHAVRCRASRTSLVDMRWTHGFRWHGGLVGGDMAYRRDPMVYRGLVSDEHAILKLFAAKVPRAHRLMTGDTKAQADETDSKLLALDSNYIEANKDMRGVLRVELDAVFETWSAIAEACRSARVPPPSIVVGYRDRGGRIINPHLIWLLSDSIAFTQAGSKRAKSLFQGVLRGLTAALAPWGADPAGIMNAMRMKNPLCPLWDRQILAEEPYALAWDAKAMGPRSEGMVALREHVDVTVRLADIVSSVVRMPVPDHDDPAVSAGSNKVFRDLATWARREVQAVRAAGGSEQEFAALTAIEAHRLVAMTTSDSCRSERAAMALARTVSRWTWANVKPRTASAPLSPERRKQLQADGARAANAIRKERTHAGLLDVASKLVRQGCKLTQQTLTAASRRGEGTVRRHWHDILAAMAGQRDRSSSPPYDKKGGEARPEVGCAPPLPCRPSSVVAHPEQIGMPGHSFAGQTPEAASAISRTGLGDSVPTTADPAHVRQHGPQERGPASPPAEDPGRSAGGAVPAAMSAGLAPASRTALSRSLHAMLPRFLIRGSAEWMPRPQPRLTAPLTRQRSVEAYQAEMGHRMQQLADAAD